MSLWKFLQEIARERRWPMFAWSNGASIIARCPECRAKITMSPIARGESAFTCPECGATAKWSADAT